MIEPSSNLEQNQSVSADFELDYDYELNGEINRASNQGSKFALLLAMLEQNSLHRPNLTQAPEDVPTDRVLSSLSHYRSASLKASEKDWAHLQQACQLVRSSHIDDARLWLAMHPEPLSQFNDPMHLSDEIIANCSLPAQTRLKNAAENNLKVDETGLYEILHEMDLPQQSAA